LLQDITERKRAEEALRESEERLRFALEAAGAGTWVAVPETGEFTASDRALAMHGATPGTPMSHEKAMETVHAADRPRVAEAVRCALATGEPYRVEFRMPLPDGSIRWVESRGEPRFVSGRQILCGLLQDITEQKRTEIALRESEELLRAIIEHVPVPILVSREDRKILLVNPALTKLTGCTLADIPTRDEWEACAYRENGQRVKGEVHAIFERGVPVDRGEIRVHTKSGEKRFWTIKAAPAGQDTSGRHLLVTVGLDITDRRRSAEEARASSSKFEAALAAMTDALFILRRGGPLHPLQ